MTRRLSFRWLLPAAGMALLGSTACGSSRIEGVEARDQLDALTAPLRLQDVDGVDGFDRGERLTCADPGFDRESPAVWVTYSVAPDLRGGVVTELRRRFESAGWTQSASSVGHGFAAQGSSGATAIITSDESVDVTVWLGDSACG